MQPLTFTKAGAEYSGPEFDAARANLVWTTPQDKSMSFSGGYAANALIKEFRIVGPCEAGEGYLRDGAGLIAVQGRDVLVYAADDGTRLIPIAWRQVGSKKEI